MGANLHVLWVSGFRFRKGQAQKSPHSLSATVCRQLPRTAICSSGRFTNQQPAPGTSPRVQLSAPNVVASARPVLGTQLISKLDALHVKAPTHRNRTDTYRGSRCRNSLNRFVSVDVVAISHCSRLVKMILGGEPLREVPMDLQSALTGGNRAAIK